MAKVFKVGDTDPYVKNIQQSLNELLGATGAKAMPDQKYLVTDGGFGSLSYTAMCAFQKSRGLPQSGQYDAGTQQILEPYIAERFLTEADYNAAAVSLGVDVACIKAVTQVESKGCGFFYNGKPVILFERHKFRAQLLDAMRKSAIVGNAVSIKLGIALGVGGPNIDVIDHTMASMYGDIYSSQVGGYQGGMAEYDRLEKAKGFHELSALSSASWGLFQIMGYWAPSIKHTSVTEMVDLAFKAERYQLTDFVNFIKANPSLLNALKALDFTAFAKGYNGAGYAANKYDDKMRDAYKVLKDK